MSRSMFVVKVIKRTFPLSLVGAKMTRIPGIGALAERLFFKGDEIMFMPRSIDIGETVGDAESSVVPWSVMEHFIGNAGFLWIMNTCICRESMKCEDYPVDLGCLFMGEAARDINPLLGRPVSKEEALEHLRRCREAGLFHLVGRNKVDSVWLNIKPGERLLTVCNCCTCCCLWRMLPELSGRIASSVSRLPGIEVRVSDACIGCGTCLTAGCMADAIDVVAGRAVIGESCLGCGRCSEVCPQGAIEVIMADEAGVREAIERLSAKVDVS